MIENMTNEQAAECLKTIHVLSFKDETATFFLTDVQNAFKLAIQALEQQPSEGVEVIRMGKNTVKARQGRFVVYDIEWLKEHFNTTEKMLYGLPSEDCTSKELVIEWLKDKDIIKTKNQEENVRRELAELPSITPSYNSIKSELEQTRPKGKWIIRPDRASDIEYRCSECGKIQFADDTNELNYCCNCGSKMEMEE